jgi:hypothetical protein
MTKKFVVTRPIRRSLGKQIKRCSQEGTLLSDYVITLAGKSITITSHDIIMTGVSVVVGLVFWTALYFSRKRIVVLKGSQSTDQLTFELSRIADALDRIANRPADNLIAEAARFQQQMQPSAQRESHGISYSMFGR